MSFRRAASSGAKMGTASKGLMPDEGGKTGVTKKWTERVMRMTRDWLVEVLRYCVVLH